jgi:hypothetical protein
MRALETAVSGVVQRHEALRTRITVRKGIPIQHVTDAHGGVLRVHELSGLPRSRQDVEVNTYITDAITDVADYGVDELCFIGLIRLGDNESRLVVALDHMISDGASISIIREELAMAYAQSVTGEGLSLPPVKMQFPDYAAWQRADLEEHLMRQARNCDHWRRTRFPEDKTHIAERADGWGTVEVILAQNTKMLLKRWARARQTSIVMAVLTAYIALVLRWCDVSKAIFQVMSDGRVSSLIERAVGYFAFPLYLNVEIGPRETLLDILDIVTAGYCNACEHPDFSYCHAKADRPGFTHNTSFNWLPKTEWVRDSRAARSETIMYSDVAFENPLLQSLDVDHEPSIVLNESESAVAGQILFPMTRFSAATMKRFARNFAGFVDALIRRPATDIHDIEIV